MSVSIVHTPPNDPGKIEELYAFVSFDGTGEGIVAAILPDLGSTPLVTGKRKLALGDLSKIAARMARTTDRTVRLVRFGRLEVLRTFEPEA